MALVRQLEASLKINGALSHDQYLIDKIDGKHIVCGGDIDYLENGKDALETEGVQLEQNYLPLTFQRSPVNVSCSGEIYKIESGDVYTDNGPFYESDIVGQLLQSPTTVSVVWFPSYNTNSRDGKEIFGPTPEELSDYLTDPENPYRMMHTMLLIGFGVDENGNE